VELEAGQRRRRWLPQVFFSSRSLAIATSFSKQFNSPWAARAANQKQPKMRKTLSIDQLSRIS
jgi:hypothetical protein